jgi:L-asparaginase
VAIEKIVVLGTGGTVAGQAASAQDNLGYTAAQVGVAALLKDIPALQGRAVVAEQVAQVDSKDMDGATWDGLAQRCRHWLAQPDVRGIVITHGTDTMEETAYFLQAALAPAKPIVLTGAMRPSTSAAADGPQNIADAVAVASTEGARGVTVAFAGKVHGALDVAKVHSYRLDAFDSGDAGPLGYVEEGRFRPVRDWPASHAVKPMPAGRPWSRVEIVMSHAGADGAIVRALVQHGVQGLVVAGTGNGTLHHALEAALLEAQSAGVKVLRTSRCAQGRVLPHAGDRLPHAPGLSPVKARIALMLALMAD